MDLKAHNLPFLRQRGRLRVYAGVDATIVIRWDGEYRQICQVGYSRDGSIRFQWPYLRIEQGIVAAVSMPGGLTGSTTINLRESGKFTSQLVKLSHHASGEALFSKTGLVHTEIRRQSFPLTGPIGRIFELHVFHPSGFKRLERLKPRRVYLEFGCGYKAPEAVIIRGEWRRKESIAEHIMPRGEVGPLTRWMHRITRTIEPVAFFAPPLTNPIQSHTLCIACSPIPLPTGATRPSVVFMGGFENHEVPPERAGEPLLLKDFLVAMFPTASDDEVRKRVGSIDMVTDPADE